MDLDDYCQAACGCDADTLRERAKKVAWGLGSFDDAPYQAASILIDPEREERPEEIARALLMSIGDHAIEGCSVLSFSEHMHTFHMAGRLPEWITLTMQTKADAR